MSDFVQPKHFRNEVVEIEVGQPLENGTYHKIKISDLKYGKRKELMGRIYEILFSVETMPITLKLFEPQLLQMISNGSTVPGAIENIKSELANVYDKVNDDQIKDLLILATDNQLTSELIDTMGGDEARNLLSWILQRSFMTEKNLLASLRTILNPKTEANT